MHKLGFKAHSATRPPARCLDIGPAVTQQWADQATILLKSYPVPIFPYCKTDIGTDSAAAQYQGTFRGSSMVRDHSPKYSRHISHIGVAPGKLEHSSSHHPTDVDGLTAVLSLSPLVSAEASNIGVSPACKVLLTTHAMTFIATDYSIYNCCQTLGFIALGSTILSNLNVKIPT